MDEWPCDVDFETDEMESNGGIEMIKEYNGKKYSIIVSWPEDEVLNPDDEANEYEDSA